MSCVSKRADAHPLSLVFLHDAGSSCTNRCNIGCTLESSNVGNVTF